MRVAVLGQGSIGARHAALLVELGHDVLVYDPRAGAETGLALEGVRRAPSELDALTDADAAIIATPPCEHLRQARLALLAGAHTLVEKPFAPSAAGIDELGALAERRSLQLGVAMNMRFHPGVATLHRLVEEGAIGRPLRARIWFGSWLPGWRAGVDYRATYSAQARLGGGVLLDSIHELDYALWTLGPVRRVRGLLAHSDTLQVDVEDIAALVLEHDAGTITSLTLDYLDRSYQRGCQIAGEEGSLQWRWEQESVVLQRATGAAEVIAAPSDVQPTYRAQLERFLETAGGGGSPATGVAEAIAALELADAARSAARSGQAVEVGPRAQSHAQSLAQLVSNNPA